MLGDWSGACLFFAQVEAAAPAKAEVAAQPKGEAAPAKQNDPLGSYGLFLPLIFIVIFYIFIIQRPQSREQRERRRLLDDLKVHDRVLTSSGIFGTVVEVDRDSDKVTLRVDESTNARIRVTLSSIGRVLDGDGVEKKAS